MGWEQFLSHCLISTVGYISLLVSFYSCPGESRIPLGGECRGGTGKWHGVRNDTNASSRVRRRGCYTGAKWRERGAGGQNLRRKESFVIGER